jgi:hypothetical protein
VKAKISDITTKKNTAIYNRILQILESARSNIARSVNTSQVVANWMIGREIVEEEQKGKKKAGYGETLLEELAALLTADFGSGYSGTNLRWFRQFYLEYPALLPGEIHHAPRDKFANNSMSRRFGIHHALRGGSPATAFQPVNSYTADGESWKPGLLHPNLSWTHYPNGLTGDKLLIESRILTVADVVESMASHRPYRPSLGIGVAIDEITKNKGVHYDPEIVDACLRLFNEKGYRMVD